MAKFATSPAQCPTDIEGPPTTEWQRWVNKMEARLNELQMHLKTRLKLEAEGKSVSEQGVAAKAAMSAEHE